MSQFCRAASLLLLLPGSLSWFVLCLCVCVELPFLPVSVSLVELCHSCRQASRGGREGGRPPTKIPPWLQPPIVSHPTYSLPRQAMPTPPVSRQPPSLTSTSSQFIKCFQTKLAGPSIGDAGLFLASMQEHLQLTSLRDPWTANMFKIFVTGKKTRIKLVFVCHRSEGREEGPRPRVFPHRSFLSGRRHSLMMLTGRMAIIIKIQKYTKWKSTTIKFACNTRIAKSTR